MSKFAALLLLGFPLFVFAETSLAAPALSSGLLSTKEFFDRPALVVVVVIDQFRADALTRLQARFRPAQGPHGVGGFNYLLQRGAYFPFAEYDTLQNMTCPGHATILTGAPPRAHHVPINEWYDDKTHKRVYCVSDEQSHLLPPAASDAFGISPRRLDASTVGDELKGFDPRNRVYTVALKDRAAVLLGGHRADLALWFETKAGAWVSSQYYRPDGLPSWVESLNAKIKPRLFKKNEWSVAGDFRRDSTYGDAASLRTPIGVELTTEAAIATLEANQLGKRAPATDLLAVSFSSHDMLGHEVGPDSREIEELTVAEDAALAQFFAAIDKSVGLKKTLIVLTGDHGMAPTPSNSRAHHFEAHLVAPEALRQRLNAELDKKYGPLPTGWIFATHSFNFYLDHDAIRAHQLSATDVETAARDVLLREPETETVITAGEIRAGHVPPGPTGRQALNEYVPGVSGDLILVPKPYSMEDDGEPVTHMTGYSYDRTVPLAFAGPHVLPGAYATHAQVIDLAPTLAFLLNILPPNKSEGRVLSEAIGHAGGR